MKLREKKDVSKERVEIIYESVQSNGLLTTCDLFDIKPSTVKGYLRYREQYLMEEPSRVLVIGDLHEPFTKEGYLSFCKEMYDKYDCNEVVFIGDILDNHYSSFHDTDPDGHSASKEFKLAKSNLDNWYSTFPKAKVCLGNHDNIPNRKAFNTGLSQR